MKRLRFTEEQIIAVLREQEAGMKTADICRKHGISDATFYKCWRWHGSVRACQRTCRSGRQRLGWTSRSTAGVTFCHSDSPSARSKP
jgi:hypothetical protein